MCVHAQFTSVQPQARCEHAKIQASAKTKQRVHANESETLTSINLTYQSSVFECMRLRKCCNGEVLSPCHKTDSFTEQRRKRLTEELLKTS